MLDTATLQIAPELLALIAEIDEFKGAWRALGVHIPDQARQHDRARPSAT